MSELFNPAKCPLCGAANDCRLYSTAADKGKCWCEQVEVPAELLARVPENFHNRACICQNCVTEFQGAKNPPVRQKVWAGDFYFENGMMVFTTAYHLRRGYCCGSGCRHCPYPKETVSIQT